MLELDDAEIMELYTTLISAIFARAENEVRRIILSHGFSLPEVVEGDHVALRLIQLAIAAKWGPKIASTAASTVRAYQSSVDSIEELLHVTLITDLIENTARIIAEQTVLNLPKWYPQDRVDGGLPLSVLNQSLGVIVWQEKNDSPAEGNSS